MRNIAGRVFTRPPGSLRRAEIISLNRRTRHPHKSSKYVSVSVAAGRRRLTALSDRHSQPVDRVIADGSYYSIERGEALSRAGITPVTPPPAHAVVHGAGQTGWHDELVKYIKDKGIYAFHKKYGYGLRSRVEAQISRIKRCLVATLLTQKIASQECEGVIIANIINLWNSFGRPVCVKNG
ncbi:hypothetical protein [Caballeronia sordidicola]|uniref:hypothetical protein n=1 Tax=Caballeronia sordidicola TaxID=196367 RepID=UPI002119ECD5|nr:hypothetical protein [Caballeronia sordidicola]